jgi:FkbM family methyltransferase
MINKLIVPVLNQIPMTRIRLFIARILYILLHWVFRKDNHIIRRHGVRYEVGLAEGIDLSLFLFGNFQNHVTSKKYLNLPENAVIFDIGANIGSMALRFAQHAAFVKIYAFEPTNFAYNKLLRNLSLNPELAQRITPVQLFLSDQTISDHHLKAYSSWRVDGSAANVHPLHGGTIKSAESVPAVTIDDFCLENKVGRIDLIKIDTDGHEFCVLQGARRMVVKHLPYIVFELGIYVMQEMGIEFEQFYAYFLELNYKLLNAKNGKNITLQNYTEQIPQRSTIDIIAIPQRPTIRDQMHLN